MASSINSNNIDGTYPVAGVDNDSQGFRTNFTNIKNSLGYAKNELEDLQSKVVLKQRLDVNGALDNSMAGASLSGAEIKDFRETSLDLTASTGTITLDHSAGHYHKVSTSSGSITIAFTAWPAAGKIGRIRLKIAVTSTSYTLSLPSAVSLGTATIDGYSSNVITFPATGTYYFEFITDDAGASIHIQDLTRPRKSTATSSIYGNTSVTTTGYFNYSNVVTGFTTTVTNTLLIDSIAALATGTIYLPDPPTDGQVVTIASNNSIGTLTLTANTGTILGKVTSLPANSNVSYQYVAGPQKWFLKSQYIPVLSRANVATGATSQATEITAISSNTTLATHTVYFPPATLAKNGETITITSNVAVTTLTLTSNGATITGGLTSLAANGFGKWIYSSSELRWIRIG